MKYCPACKTDKPRSEFHAQKKRYDGLQSNCKACKSSRSAASFKSDKDYRLRQNESNKRNRKEKAAFVRAYKTSKGCLFCSENHEAALDLHHVDPSIKDSAVSQMLYNSLEKIETEIAKCVVLCSNCHRKHHAGVEGYEITGLVV